MKSVYSFFLLLILYTSCKEEFLDVIPKNQLSDDSMWTSPANADLFLNDIYYSIPYMNDETQPLDQYTDNSYVGAEWMWGKTTIATAAVNPSNVPPGPADMFNWEIEYRRIRKCNLFISKVTTSDLPLDYKRKRLAEARFLRALFYHWLYMSVGGVPIITNVLNNTTQGDSIFRERNTEEETFNFLTSELAEIADELPVKKDLAPSDFGRPTKGAALTLKAVIELFKAGEQRNPQHHIARWITAAATFREVMGLGYSLVPDFGKIWMPENNNSDEVIFDQQMSLSRGGSREGKYGVTYVKGSQQSWGNFEPTQELVDEFAMANGLPIKNPASGYDPQKPFENREPRFYKSIIYDGCPWQGDTIWTRVGIGSKNEIDLAASSDVTNTGYYASKTLDERITGQDNLSLRNGTANYIFFRYAEVLLGYAEAENEAVGPDQSVLDAVNLVRARAGLKSVELTFGNVDQIQMREIIRRERRVEFAFEDKRWWDILRWKIGSEALNTQLTGMYIAKVNGVWTYNRVKVTSRVWNDKMYLWPIPQAALDQNPKLKWAQNPGY